MLRSLFTGVSGMDAFQTKLDVIGNNIANADTVGFKAGRAMFSDILSQTISGSTAPVDGTSGGVNPEQVGLGASVDNVDTLFTQGSPETTGVTTDLRIDGDGFFAVKTDSNQSVPYLTRAGNFKVDAGHQLVNSDGMLVMSQGGSPVTLGSSVTAFTIDKTGQIISVDNQGNTTPTGQYIGVVKVTNPGGLKKIGGNLYQMTPNADENGVQLSYANDSTVGTGAIESGQLEMSNVDLTREFSNMIVAERGFQANARTITTSDQILQEIVNLKH